MKMTVSPMAKVRALVEDGAKFAAARLNAASSGGKGSGCGISEL